MKVHASHHRRANVSRLTPINCAANPVINLKFPVTSKEQP